MEITIDVSKSTVTVDTVLRRVVFPSEYSAVSTIQFNTDTATGLITYANRQQSDMQFTSVGVCNTALELWNAAAPSAAEVWDLIKDKRTLVNSGGVYADGDWFHTDAETRGQYAIMYAAISVNSLPDSYQFNSSWKTMSGTFRQMTVHLLKLIVNIGISNAAANYANAETHRQALMSSSTPHTYDYSSGWTAVHV
jgi:hypothetical protein